MEGSQVMGNVKLNRTAKIELNSQKPAYEAQLLLNQDEKCSERMCFRKTSSDKIARVALQRKQ